MLVSGDVVMCRLFVFGQHEFEKDNKLSKEIRISPSEGINHWVTVFVDDNERLLIAAKTGTVPPETRNINTTAYDQTRGLAKFVVIEANDDGGGYAQGERMPSGCLVKARRLKENGDYDPQGELISFYTSGPGNIIDESFIQKVGHKNMITNFV